MTIASRGYPQRGAGAEARFGEGIIGLVAEAQKPIRISGLMRGMLHAYAAQAPGRGTGLAPEELRMPLPGLENPASQLGVPLMVRGELVGVLVHRERDAVPVPRGRQGDDRAARVVPRDRDPERSCRSADDAARRRERAADRAPATARGRGQRGRAQREVTYYKGDEVVMVDGDYLIRGLPARILWKLLSTHQSEGRAEFTNRELRLDKSLQLPEYKDNLETRLLLLRRRLDREVPGHPAGAAGPRPLRASSSRADVALVERP